MQRFLLNRIGRIVWVGLFLSLILFAGGSWQPVWAGDSDEGDPYLRQMAAVSLIPPQRVLPKTSQDKLERAQCLSTWVRGVLAAEGAEVAILARTGHWGTGLVDSTGMTHLGLVLPVSTLKPVFKAGNQADAGGVSASPSRSFIDAAPEGWSSPTGSSEAWPADWVVYGLYSHQPPAGARKPWTAQIWSETLENFYYDQKGLKAETMVFIPKKSLQPALLRQFTQGYYRHLLPENHHFNLLAPLDSPTSFNCAKWLLLNLYAAKYPDKRPLGNDQPAQETLEALIQTASREESYPPTPISVLFRTFFAGKSDVVWSELDNSSRVTMVSAQQLAGSSLFEKVLRKKAGESCLPQHLKDD